MQNHPTTDKKLADWGSVFNSIPDQKSQEAKILRSLILEYHAKPKTKEEIKIASC
jgi:hypothetical protein